MIAWWSEGHPDLVDAAGWHASRATGMETAALVEVGVAELTSSPGAALRARRMEFEARDQWAIAVTAMCCWTLSEEE